MTDLRSTAIHEAGHAVAAVTLAIPIDHVSIVPAEGNLGHFQAAESWRRRIGDEVWAEAEYESDRGGFVKRSVRFWVERHIMMTLAGSLAEMKATGCKPEDTGSGLMAGPLAAEWLASNGQPGDAVITGGDLMEALQTAQRVSGSDDEASQYVAWLEERTGNMVADPLFGAAADAVADGLLAQDTLKGPAIRKLIQEGKQAHATASLNQRLRAFRERTGRL